MTLPQPPDQNQRPGPGTPVSAQGFLQDLIQSIGANTNTHIMHAVISVISCGLWLPVWFVHTILMAIKHRADTGPSAAPVRAANQGAVAEVHARATLRAKARELAAANPIAARELHIGRVDLPQHLRGYDDGGLIDINAMPAEHLTAITGIDLATAKRIVATRDQIGGFSSAEEAASLAQLPPDVVPELAEFGLFS